MCIPFPVYFLLFQNADIQVAIKCVTKKNLMKQADLLSKEIQILKVSCGAIFLPLIFCQLGYRLL